CRARCCATPRTPSSCCRRAGSIAPTVSVSAGWSGSTARPRAARRRTGPPRTARARGTDDMGKLVGKPKPLFDGLISERDAYDKRPGCDPEIIAQGLAPITDVERRGMARLSSVDVELLTHKLSAIVEEARDVYMALSISEGIITGDMNCGLFTASGDP